ncbi:uncharacterized protein ACA1_369130 [Acanthamoeba castellanii str. Neff]|uniref:HORMA domain-containing protein n=1 Tax=Acanthamoeba castellanii (strain ATCC 30010 / Neff) TaxID=1257118 RepID=L8H1D9_ACACF|nr:uncharacterized protein ACA1_369130 [Acanthamoeba castellanii str. Neff]ELR18181.1 hypothetical protein ACA1_369130 [Acanthamoeba castellanii str. Neff]
MVRSFPSQYREARNRDPDRGAVPDCFADKSLAGIHIKSLLPQNGEDPEKENTLIECYNCAPTSFNLGMMRSSTNTKYCASSPNEDIVMKLSQTEGGAKKNKLDIRSNKYSKDEIKRAVQLSQTLKPLPATERYLQMKILYYDKVTPVEYEPKYFKQATWEEPFVFDSSPVKIKVGEIATPYHTLSMRLRTNKPHHNTHQTVDLFEDDGEGERTMPAEKTGAKYNVEMSSSDEEEEDSSDPDCEEEEKPDEDEQYAAVKAAVEAAGVCKLSFIKTQFPKLADQAINRFLVRMVQDKVLQLQDGEYKIFAQPPPARSPVLVGSPAPSSSPTPRSPSPSSTAIPEEIYKAALKALSSEDFMTAQKLRSLDILRRLQDEGFISRTISGNKGRRVVRHQATDSAGEKPAGPASPRVKRREQPAAKRKHSLLSRRLKNLELAHSQDSEADTVKCSRTAEPLVQKRRKLAKEE